MLGKKSPDPIVYGESAAIVRDMAIESAKHALSTRYKKSLDRTVVIQHKNVKISW